MGSGEFRRRYTRKPYSSEVIVSVRDRAYAGSLKDISTGGAFVMTPAINHIHTGDVLIIRIPFTDGKRSVKRRGRVLWTNDEGVALEFF